MINFVKMNDITQYLGYQVSVTLGESGVGADSRVVQSSEVVGNLVSKAVVAQGAGLLGNGHHVTVPDAIK